MPKSLRTLYRKLFEEKSTRNKFQQKPLPKKYWQKYFYHKPPEEKSPQSNFQKKPRQKKYLMKKSTKKKSTKKYLNIKFDPNMSEEKFAGKKDSRNFGGKSSPIYPWRNFFGNCFLGKQFPQIVINQLPNRSRRIHGSFLQKALTSLSLLENSDRKLSKPKIL